MTTRSLSLGWIPFALILLAGCGGDDGGGGSSGPTNPETTQVPLRLQGIWEQTSEAVDCDAATAGLFREAVTETVQICPATFVQEPGQFDDIPCEFTWSDGDTRLDIDCGGTLTIASCTTDFSLVGTITYLSDTEVEFEYRNEIRSTGTCDFPIDECNVQTGSMVQLSTSVEDCEIPDTGGGGEGLNLTITGGGNAGSVDFQTVAAQNFGGFAYTIVAATQPNFTNYRNLNLSVPADIAVGSPIPLDASDFIYVETRDGTAWSLDTFDGTITMSRADASRVAGTFSGSGEMLNSATLARENVTFAGDFDLPVSDVSFRPGFAEPSVPALIARALAER